LMVRPRATIEHVTQVLIAIALSAWFGQSESATPKLDPALVRVYLRAGDAVEARDLAARRETVKDLAAAIGTRKKSLVLAADEDLADVIVEVGDRTAIVPRIVVGIGPGLGRASGSPAPVARTVHLRVRLELARGGDDVEFENKNRAMESGPGWRSAAEDIVKQIEKWVADHRAAILAARRTDGRGAARW
jgi:hypothetical protein